MTNQGTGLFPHLFSPVKIGGLELKNRLIMSPVGTRLAKDGMVTESFKDFYIARAKGGVGMIVLEPCFVEATGEGKFLSLHEDRFIPGLKGLVEAIHGCGIPIGVQLFHAGWQQGKSDARFLPPIPPAALSVDQIKGLIEKFARAAARAKVAGFDLIEIHAAHGYLLSQFLSPLGNRRMDEYGVDTKGRARFVTEILQTVRERVGKDYPLSCRINGAEHVPGGLVLEDARRIAEVLEGAGLQLLSISAGALGSYPLTIPPCDTQPGCYAPLSAGIKEAVNLPVVVAGRINTPELAEEVLSVGKADLVAMARGLVADPELPNKALAGEVTRVRKCIACNVCLDSDYDGHITCTVNSTAGREKELEIVPAPETRRIVVVGGGPAGLEAARIAALRGHRVTVFEQNGQIGGQWRIAACPPHKQEFLSLLDWFAGELERGGVKVTLGKKATREVVANLKPDVVIVATGAAPLLPPIRGIDRKEVVHAWDVLKDQVSIGKRVLVIGGGATGLETAECLAEHGKKVTVVEMLGNFGIDMGGTVSFHLRFRLKKLGVELIKNTRVQEIGDSGVKVSKDGREETWHGFDTVVVALGVKSRDDLAEALSGVVPEIRVIGDAARPGKGVDAIRQGTEIGRRV